MTMDFVPRLGILAAPQRRLWEAFSAVPEEFVLYGGTAVALHLGHRDSIDFDFFDRKPLDPALPVPAMLDLAGAMKTIPLNADTKSLARRLVWFEEPSEALSDQVRFLAYAMARATHEDMKILRQFLDDDDFREALDHAPPGIIDARSWAYWNSRFGRYPSPPLPVRQIG